MIFIGELLLLLIEVVLVPAIPIVAAFLVKYFKSKSDEALTNMENEIVKSLLFEVAEAVYSAVTFTSQTFVDTLKAQGAFDAEAQKSALNTALDKTKLMPCL